MDILKFLGQVIAYGGGAVVIAYMVFIFLGKKAVEDWFGKRMEAYKNAQAQILEEYKYKINALFNRVTKIHEKEFDVLPLAWEKLQIALRQVRQLASPVQYYPDFSFMSETELDEFIETTKLRKHEIEKLRIAPDKNEYYKKVIFWYETYEAKEKIKDLHNFLLLNKIFFSKDLFEEFGKVDQLLFNMISNMEVNRKSNNETTVLGLWKQLNSQVMDMSGKIEEIVQARLHYNDA